MRPCIITVSPLPSSDKCLHGTRGQGPETLLLSSVPRRGPRGRKVLPRAGEQLASTCAAPVCCSVPWCRGLLGVRAWWGCAPVPGGCCHPAPAGLGSTKLLSTSPVCAGICGFCFCSGKQNVDGPCRSAQRVSGTWDRERSAGRNLVPACSGCCSQNWRPRSRGLLLTWLCCFAQVMTSLLHQDTGVCR